jgi:tetratricopeptide (TPR) repeat protein
LSTDPGTEQLPEESRGEDGKGLSLSGASGVQVGSGNLQVNNFYDNRASGRSLGFQDKQLPARLPARYVHGVALPRNWADRSDEIKRISLLLERGDVRVLNIVAIGGTGKTSVVRKVADLIDNGAGRFDSLVWFSFYRDDDVERFFLEACRYLVPAFDPAEYESTFERASLLQDTIAPRGTLIVLDGFEKIVDIRSAARAGGKIGRREMASFLSWILSSGSRSAVVLTSRVRLGEFAEADGFLEMELPDLRPDAAFEFLRSGGIAGPARSVRQVADSYGCHALALAVYLDYARYRSMRRDVREIDVPLTFPSESGLADRLDRLLLHYYTHLDNDERAILSWISASPRGLEISELRSLSNPGALTSPGGTAHESVPIGPLRRLSASVLITSNEDGRVIRFDSHPVIKAFCYDRLLPGDRRRVHQQLLALARALPVPTTPATIQEIHPLLDVFWHALAVDDADEAYAAWRDERVHRGLLWWGSYQPALEIIDQLLKAPAYRVETSRAARGRLLGEAAILLVKLGRPQEALQAYSEGIACTTSDRERSLKLLLDMSEAQMEVGVFLDAAQTLQRAESLFSQVSGFPVYKLTGRKGQLAAALSSLAQAEETLGAALSQVADWERASPPGYTCLFLRTRGDLRCANGLLDEAEDDYQAALQGATDSRWRFLDYEGHVRRGLGDLASFRLNEAEANSHFASALDLARRIGYGWLEAEVFVAKAHSALRFENLEEAGKWAEEGYVLAKSGGWVALAAESLLVKSECSKRRNEAELGNYLASARSLILRSGKRSLKSRYTEICGEVL